MSLSNPPLVGIQVCGGFAVILNTPATSIHGPTSFSKNACRINSNERHCWAKGYVQLTFDRYFQIAFPKHGTNLYSIST